MNFPHNLVGCEWGITSVYFEFTYVCFIPSRPAVFVVGSKYQHLFIFFLSKVQFEGRSRNLRKILCRFKTWMGFLGQIHVMIKFRLVRFHLSFSLFDVWCPITINVCKHAGGRSLSDHWSVPLTLRNKFALEWISTLFCCFWLFHILMPYNIILYFRLLYFHVSNCALFST